jgi:hypothetical protein
MNIRQEMQQLVTCWSGTSEIDSKMGMIRTFQASAKNIRLALNLNTVISSLGRGSAENQQMIDLAGLEWGCLSEIVYRDFKVSNK